MTRKLKAKDVAVILVLSHFLLVSFYVGFHFGRTQEATTIEAEKCGNLDAPWIPAIQKEEVTDGANATNNDSVSEEIAVATKSMDVLPHINTTTTRDIVLREEKIVAANISKKETIVNVTVTGEESVNRGTKKKEKKALVFDFVSVGSEERPAHQEAQERAMASHMSVRNFFRVTEKDDFDPSCATNLTQEQLFRVVGFCRSRKRWGEHKQVLMRYMKYHYANKYWLKIKSNPTGWMCAQVRPSMGFAKAIGHYQRIRKRLGSYHLPDYLVVLDDDTYFNMELVEKYMSQWNPSTPRAVAGCRVRYPVKEFNFTIPLGGFGTFFSKGSILKFLQPLHCSSVASGGFHDAFETGSCRQIAENQIGEKEVFQDGMSLGDLIREYVSHWPFRDVMQWTAKEYRGCGFCLHSDWMWGVFANYYNTSVHVDDPGFEHVSRARLFGYQNSERGSDRGTVGICQNDSPQRCRPSSHICHYQTPESMMAFAKRTQSRYPESFRVVGK